MEEEEKRKTTTNERSVLLQLKIVLHRNERKTMTEEISVNNPSTFLENNYSGKESSTNPSDEENLFFSGQKTDETM